MCVAPQKKTPQQHRDAANLKQREQTADEPRADEQISITTYVSCFRDDLLLFNFAMQTLRDATRSDERQSPPESVQNVPHIANIATQVLNQRRSSTPPTPQH